MLVYIFKISEIESYCGILCPPKGLFYHLETFFGLLNAKYSRMQLRPSQFLIHFEIL